MGHVCSKVSFFDDSSDICTMDFLFRLRFGRFHGIKLSYLSFGTQGDEVDTCDIK
jgi:hypothetical protein